MVLAFEDKALLGIISSLVIALVFSVSEIYFFAHLEIGLQFYLILQLFSLSVPFYFFLINMEDSVIGLFSGMVYYSTKGMLLSFVKTEPFCVFDVLVFSIAFFIYCLAISFHREQSLKNVRFSLIGMFGILLAFSVSVMMTTFYFSTFSGMLCFYPQKYLPFVFGSFE